MKSFKGYLQEAPAWTESLSTALFDLPRAGLKDVRITGKSTIGDKKIRWAQFSQLYLSKRMKTLLAC